MPLDTTKLFTDAIQTTRTQARQARLLEAAKRALRWFDSYNGGHALNSQHDAVLVARALYEATADVDLDGVHHDAAAPVA